MKVYIAGPLFSESQIASRRNEAEKFKRQIEGIEIFNPIDAPYNEDKSNTLPSPQEIYWGDAKEIESSDFLVFNFEDLTDPGVCLEIGLVCGNPNSKTVLIGVMSDIRLPSAASYQIPSLGYNHMVVGAVIEHGYIVEKYQQAIDIVGEAMEMQRK